MASNTQNLVDQAAESGAFGPFVQLGSKLIGFGKSDRVTRTPAQVMANSGVDPNNRDELADAAAGNVPAKVAKNLRLAPVTKGQEQIVLRNVQSAAKARLAELNAGIGEPEGEAPPAVVGPYIDKPAPSVFSPESITGSIAVGGVVRPSDITRAARAAKLEYTFEQRLAIKALEKRIADAKAFGKKVAKVFAKTAGKNPRLAKMLAKLGRSGIGRLSVAGVISSIALEGIDYGVELIKQRRKAAADDEALRRGARSKGPPGRRARPKNSVRPGIRASQVRSIQSRRAIGSGGLQPKVPRGTAAPRPASSTRPAGRKAANPAVIAVYPQVRSYPVPPGSVVYPPGTSPRRVGVPAPRPRIDVQKALRSIGTLQSIYNQFHPAKGFTPAADFLRPTPPAAQSPTTLVERYFSQTQSFVTEPRSQAKLELAEKCYTVCRKPKKAGASKKKARRVCITPAKALRHGITLRKSA